MKVKELLALLEDMDPNTEIRVLDNYTYFSNDEILANSVAAIESAGVGHFNGEVVILEEDLEEAREDEPDNPYEVNCAYLKLSSYGE